MEPGTKKENLNIKQLKSPSEEAEQEVSDFTEEAKEKDTVGFPDSIQQARLEKFWKIDNGLDSKMKKMAEIPHKRASDRRRKAYWIP